MNYKSILAYLDGGTAGTEVMRIASQLAVRFDAHLVAAYGVDWPMFAMAAMDPSAGDMIRYQIEAEELSEKTARDQIAASQAASGCAVEWRRIPADLVASLTLQARHSDLVVMAQEQPGDFLRGGPTRVSSVALSAGRPVLAVPYAGSLPPGTDCGSSVIFAWNGSREAARAAADALPLMAAARNVTVVAFHSGKETSLSPFGGASGIAAADIGLWLARHGVKVTVDARHCPDAEIGGQVLNLVSDSGADLVVMGAYGHSRASEFVLGGVTRTLLQSMTVPVLLSH